MTSPRRDNYSQFGFTFAQINSWLSDNKTFGYPLAAFALIWPVLTGLGGQLPPGAFLPISIHLYDLLGATATFAGVLTARYVLLITKARWHRPLATVLIWVIIASSAAAFQLAVMFSVGPVSDSFVSGAPITALVTLGQLFVFTLISRSTSELRSTARELSKVRQRLTFIRANLDKQLTANRELLLEKVQSLIMPTLNRLQAEFANDADNARLAERLKSALDQEVRPLSHSLFEGTLESPSLQLTESDDSNRTKSRVQFVEAFKQKLPISGLFNLPLYMATSMIFILPGFWAIYGSSQGLLPALGALASALVFWVSLVKIASNRRASFGWLIAIGFFGSVATAGLFIEANVLLGQSADSEFTAYQGLNLAVVSIGNVLFSAFQSLRWIQLGLVAGDNTSTELLVARLRQDLWLTRQRLAKLIHGIAQSRLQAAALLLRKQDANQADRNAAAASLQVLVDELFEPGAPKVQFKQNLQNLQALWAGVCEVHVDLEPSILAELESDSSAAGCLDEFLREAVTNAVKHSGADEIEVLVEQIPGPALSVRVRHALAEGLTELPKTQTGFGSKLYEAVTASWSLKDDGIDVILDGIIPWTPETEV